MLVIGLGIMLMTTGTATAVTSMATPYLNCPVSGPMDRARIDVATTTVGVGGTISLTGIPKSYTYDLVGSGSVLLSGTRTFIYSWFCDEGTFTSPASATTIWLAPVTPGTYTIVCTVTEGTITIGNLDPKTYGQQQVTATAIMTAVAPKIATIVVTPGTATVEVSGSKSFFGQAYDDWNNPIDVLLAWATTIGSVSPTSGSTTVFTAGTTPTTGTLTATYGSITGYATITITPGTLSYIMVSPATATVAVNGSRTFTAKGCDCFGNLIPGLIFNWSATDGIIIPVKGSSTLFTAGNDPGTVTLTAEIDVIHGTATIVVYQPITQILTRITITLATTTVRVESSTSAIATGYDQYDVPMELGTCTWSTTIGSVTIGSLTSNAIFTAGTKATTGTITVTSGTITTTATITITSGIFATYTLPDLPSRLEFIVGTSSPVGTVSYWTMKIKFFDIYGNPTTIGTSTAWFRMAVQGLGGGDNILAFRLSGSSDPFVYKFPIPEATTEVILEGRANISLYGLPNIFAYVENY